MALIVYLNRTWTGIHIWCGIASACALIPCYIIPESPRWLAQNNQVEESMKVFLAASFERKNIIFDRFDKVCFVRNYLLLKRMSKNKSCE